MDDMQDTDDAEEAPAGEPVITAENREIDLDSLKGLAHPLRVQIYDILSTYGSYTASGLAERLGESSGATSYHLRQLQRHGFVREVEGKGVGRERWWERVPGGVSLRDRNFTDSPSALASADMVSRQWERSRAQLLADYTERSRYVLSPEWTDAAAVNTINVRVTVEQLTEIVRELDDFAVRVLSKFRGLNDPGSRPVQIHINAFPVLDGQETPLEPAAELEPATERETAAELDAAAEEAEGE
jgi:DNA-binding transcriptional ArsR family regulator